MIPAQAGGNKAGKKLTEGIRFELQPTTKSREDNENNIQIMKIVSKHIKVKPELDKEPGHSQKESLKSDFIPSSLISTYPELGLVYSTKTVVVTTETSTASNNLEDFSEDEEGLLFAMTSGNRRLLSAKFESSSDLGDSDYKDPAPSQEVSTESNSANIDRFVDKLKMNRKMGVSESSLKHFIEGKRQKNIKIYSTPQPPAFKPTSKKPDNADEGEPLPEDSAPYDRPKHPSENSNSDEEDPDSLITINKSSMKLGTNPAENFLGKILMSVQDPDFGQQNFNLMFDVPLVMNFKEELMMMNDNMNYPNVYNQFDIYTESTMDPQLTEMNPDDMILSNSTLRRLKRETEATAIWSDKSKDSIPTATDPSDVNKIEDVSTAVTVVPSISFVLNSSATADSSMNVTAANSNLTVSNATGKSNRGANPNTLAVFDNMTLSDFFGVVGNWFKALEYGKLEKPRKSSG